MNDSLSLQQLLQSHPRTVDRPEPPNAPRHEQYLKHMASNLQSTRAPKVGTLGHS